MVSDLAIRTGDMVYLPSEVRLMQYNDNGLVVKYCKTEKPQNVLVTGHQQDHSFLLKKMYRVFFKGEQWFAKTEDLYPVYNKVEKHKW